MKESGVDTAATTKSEDDVPKKESAGTGELYVKSNDVKADGGDFDATKPGAGKEADRELLFCFPD